MIRDENYSFSIAPDFTVFKITAYIPFWSSAILVLLPTLKNLMVFVEDKNKLWLLFILSLKKLNSYYSKTVVSEKTMNHTNFDQESLRNQTFFIFLRWLF